MAGEETKSFRITFNKGGDSVAIDCNTAQDMAGAQMCNITQNITDAGTDVLNFGAVTKAGASVVVKNLDSLNSVSLGLASGVAAPFCDIPPLDFIRIFVPTGVTNMYGKSSTGTVQIAVIARDA